MQYPTSLSIRADEEKIKKVFATYLYFAATFLLLTYITTFMSNGGLKVLLMVFFLAGLFISGLASYRVFSARKGKHWIKLSKNGVRDHFGLLKLGRVPIGDLRYVKIVNFKRGPMLKVRASLQSSCFHDLDEPKGLFVDLYNVFFKGRVWLPLSAMKVDLDALEDYLKYYNEYLQHLKSSEVVKPSNSLKVFSKPPKKSEEETQVSAPSESAVVEEKRINVDEVTSIDIDPAPPEFNIDESTSTEVSLSRDDTQVEKIANSLDDDTIFTSLGGDNIGFARKLCDAYVESLRWLPQQELTKAQESTLLLTDLTILKPSESQEEVLFNYKGDQWKVAVIKQEGTLESNIKLFINDILMFDVTAEVELGSLEPSKVNYETPGLWQQQALELFENLQRNKAFS